MATPEHEAVSTHQKAARLNMEPDKYGTFAEIGAAQEVVGWFFRSGRASGTVAKSMSAYDMVVSDAIYGPSDRYVSRRRLQSMLDHEYALLIERLESTRGTNTRFFAFADTVASGRRSQPGSGNGWMGIRFQSAPHAPHSEILLHVRLLDPVRLRSQEVVGILGVNLIYGAFYQHRDPNTLIASLMDGLSRVRLEIDMIKFSGPAFEGCDNRLMSLQLVEQGLTDVAMFTAGAEVVEPAEILFGKPVLLQRGSFRPVTNVTLDMLSRGRDRILSMPGVDSERLVVLLEMSLNNLMSADVVDHRDFLARVDILSELGYPVMISSYATSHRVTGYVRRYTKEQVAHVMGLNILRGILNVDYYKDLAGGILEALGLLLQGQTALYVYPMWDAATGQIASVDDFRPPENLCHLFRHLVENDFVVPLERGDAGDLRLLPSDILDRIRTGDPSWETLVPEMVVEKIRTDKLFDYREPTHAA